MMSDSDPLVSVVIPTFNRARYLCEAIDSVLNQTYPYWELIIVDDGSTDETQSNLETLADARVQVLRRPHEGNVARARNVGLERARGHYVAFLDSDDRWMPSKLQFQVADLAEKAGNPWGYTFYEQIGEHGEEVPFPRHMRRRPSEGWILEGLLRGEAWVATSTVLVERELMADIGGFDEALPFSEDYDAFIRLAMRSAASLVAFPHARYRVHPGNTRKGHDAIDIVASRIRLHAKLMAQPLPKRIRRLSRREYVLAATELAGVYRGRRAYRMAFAALGQRLWYAPAVGAWWLSLLKTCIHPFVPRVLLRAYRSWRA
jgi:glycosyltransferase involved in cell wall biosynthesis